MCNLARRTFLTVACTNTHSVNIRVLSPACILLSPGCELLSPGCGPLSPGCVNSGGHGPRHDTDQCFGAAPARHHPNSLVRKVALILEYLHSPHPCLRYLLLCKVAPELALTSSLFGTFIPICFYAKLHPNLHSSHHCLGHSPSPSAECKAENKATVHGPSWLGAKKMVRARCAGSGEVLIQNPQNALIENTHSNPHSNPAEAHIQNP